MNTLEEPLAVIYDEAHVREGAVRENELSPRHHGGTRESSARKYERKPAGFADQLPIAPSECLVEVGVACAQFKWSALDDLIH
ncbi:MAG TPA: hypothetical protein K8V94_08380, partial [Corynebacterium amycolatum]|nr:hypothetical protein [Corynebacterium amycolatum]